jgi:hypothetical protein
VTCDGCGRSGAGERLWLAAPVGRCCVRVHRDRACAEAAREDHGGGRFVPEPTADDATVRVIVRPSPEQQAHGRLLLDGVRAEVARMRERYGRGEYDSGQCLTARHPNARRR